ncbi:hypothetical protein BHYA_0355g00060 [Botrytis hyacinthi]|uniref:Uncharacterized protein n=1 Tax=Botrytis hyacinthi TaxID=278943 RepID=A0A4Z1G500_9HELO|nr:hypothetical protein BHYA_0355g00060 [Botrytis hyacinthi]
MGRDIGTDIRTDIRTDIGTDIGIDTYTTYSYTKYHYLPRSVKDEKGCLQPKENVTHANVMKQAHGPAYYVMNAP